MFPTGDVDFEGSGVPVLFLEYGENRCGWGLVELISSSLSGGEVIGLLPACECRGGFFLLTPFFARGRGWARGKEGRCHDDHVLCSEWNSHSLLFGRGHLH